MLFHVRQFSYKVAEHVNLDEHYKASQIKDEVVHYHVRISVTREVRMSHYQTIIEQIMLASACWKQ